MHYKTENRTEPGFFLNILIDLIGFFFQFGFFGYFFLGFLGFGSVFPVWLGFGSVFFSGFLSVSVRFGFFGFLFTKPKPNRPVFSKN